MLKQLSITLMALLIAATYSHAQEKENSNINPNLNYTKSLKLYTGFAIEGASDANNYDFGDFLFNPTFQWRNKNYNFQEIGLNSFFATKTDAWLSLRYQYNLTFMKHSKSKLIPALGIGASPFVGWQHYKPETSNAYNYHQIAVGARVFVTPRLSYFFSKNIYLDIEIPINLFQIDCLFQKDSSPNLTATNQISNTLNFNTTSNGSGLRLGIGWQL